MEGRDAAPMVLNSSRRKWLAVLGGSLAFVAVGGWMIEEGEGATAWLVALFFGACAVMAALTLVLPGRLYLTSEGVRVQQLGRERYAIRWSECDNFRPWSPTRGGSLVVFDWTSTDPRSRGTMARLSRGVASSNAGLPDTYGMKAQDLARLLQSWHDRYVDAGSGRPGEQAG